MNHQDRKFEYLKTSRWIAFLNNNLNFLFLLILWVNHFKSVFWVMLVFSILEMCAGAYLRTKKERELGLEMDI